MEDPDLSEEAIRASEVDVKKLIDPVTMITLKTDRFSYYLLTMKPQLG